MVPAADLRGTTLFSNLRDEELTALEHQLTPRRYRRGDVVFYQYDPSGRLYVIRDGWVKITQHTDAGDELLIDIFGPGSIFGELSIFTNEPRSGTVTAVEDATLLSLTRESFYGLVRTHPDIALKCLEMLAYRLRAADTLVQDLAFLDVPARLAKRLLELASQAGVDVEDGTLINIRVTQEELATMVGTTRESINKTLALFRRQGAISKRGSHIVVKDVKKLESRVY